MAAASLRTWTDELARDPQSIVFLRIAEHLRRGGHLDEARRVVLRGLERHPYMADAHDALARVLVDSGEEVAARDEWEMALRLEPSHPGALKGLGFLAWRRRDLPTADRLLAQAVRRAPSDEGLVHAYHAVRKELRGGGTGADRATPPSPDRLPAQARTTPVRANLVSTPSTEPRSLFATLLGDGDRTALLLDRDGLVLAGTYVDAEGREVSEEIGGQLSGLADESARALDQLGLGAWESLLVEAQHATVALAPAPEGAVVLVAAARDTPVGLVRHLLGLARQRAAAWLQAVA
jgi:predicted regulator of Ras-like GTPase activity (Roadblock/LC7/MglB family)